MFNDGLWLRSGEFSAMTTILQLVDDHFATLGATDVLDFGDGYSRLLKPDRASGTALDHLLKAFAEVLAASGLAAWRHVNYSTFRHLFEQIEAQIEVPVILETGSSAYGTNSSMLFAALAEVTGGRFDTVDISPATVGRVAAALNGRYGQSPRLRTHCGDSVQFIHSFEGAAPNVAYLDSFDLDPGHFDESAQHGLREFECLIPKLACGTSLILIDDTPRSREIFRKMCPPAYLTAVDAHHAKTGRLPGKGELVVEAIRSDHRFTILDWEYQLLLAYSS